MAEVQDYRHPPPSPAALWSPLAHGATRSRRSGGTRTRITAAKATAPAGNYGEGQDRQHTERAGQNRSGNAGNGSPQTVSVFLLLWRGLQKPVALVAAGPPPVPVCWPTLNGLREQTAPQDTWNWARSSKRDVKREDTDRTE